MTPRDGVTDEEKALIVVNKFWTNYVEAVRFKKMAPKQPFVKDIAEALKAAREEGFDEGLKKAVQEPSLYWKGYFAAVEEAARVCEENDEVTNLKTAKRYLEKKSSNNVNGLAYAEGIRKLKRGVS